MLYFSINQVVGQLKISEIKCHKKIETTCIDKLELMNKYEKLISLYLTRVKRAKAFTLKGVI